MGLRPFFGYYGGKWRDTPRLYPDPVHDVVIEPFAGSAGYSVRHYQRQVVLYEKDPVVAAVWRFLIDATPEEIRAIPFLEPGQTVDDLDVEQPARWLVGFWLNRGVARPRKRPSSWMRSGKYDNSFWGERVRETIATQVDLIKHWEIHPGSYEECQHEGPATWFVDPPYAGAGKHYKFGPKQISYAQLGLWCRERTGQVIVCENNGAKWLPFRELEETKTTRRRRSQEVYWRSDFDDPAGGEGDQ